jgi:hypothetical protein
MIERINAALEAVTLAANAYANSVDENTQAIAAEAAAVEAAGQARDAQVTAAQIEADALDALRQRVDELDEILAPAPAKARPSIARR